VLYIGIPIPRAHPSWGKSRESIIIAPNSAAGGFVAQRIYIYNHGIGLKVLLRSRKRAAT